MRRRRSSSSSEDIPLIVVKSSKYDQVQNKEFLHRPTEEQCEICLKLFQNKYTYLVHNASHIIIPLIKLEFHQCKTCLKLFTSQNDLVNHIVEYHYQQNGNTYQNGTNGQNGTTYQNGTNKLNEEEIDINEIINVDFNKPYENKVKGYISVKKNIFINNNDNINRDGDNGIRVKEETEVTNNKTQERIAELPSNNVVNIVKEEDSNLSEKPSSGIRSRIVFEDDGPALPSSLLNEIVNDCKDAIDLIEPSWLLNNLTHDNFASDDENLNDIAKQNDVLDVLKQTDCINTIDTDLCMQIVADSCRVKNANETSMFQNGGNVLQNGDGVLQNGAGILINNNGILNSTNIINKPMFFNVASDIGKSNTNNDLQYGGIRSQIENNIRKEYRIQNVIDMACHASLVANISNVYKNTEDTDNLLKSVIHDSQMHNSVNMESNINTSQLYLDSIQYTSNLNNTCPNCIQLGQKCPLHDVSFNKSIEAQNIVKYKQNNTKSNARQRGVSKRKQDQVYSNQLNVHGHQHEVHGHQQEVHGHQHEVHGHQHEVHSHQNSVRKRKRSQNKSEDKSFVWNSTKSVHYSELLKPGIYKCKRCCKIYPNRLKLLKHEPTHITFDRSKPDPCYFCEKYIEKEAMEGHCNMYHNGSQPVYDISPKKCKICSLNAFNWSVHYDLYHSSDRIQKTEVKKPSLDICETCYREIKVSFQEHRVCNYSNNSNGDCVRCKKQPVAKKVYNWTKKPLGDRLKDIQKRLKMMNKF